MILELSAREANALRTAMEHMAWMFASWDDGEELVDGLLYRLECEDE